jgi:hypothetical protein
MRLILPFLVGPEICVRWDSKRKQIPQAKKKAFGMTTWIGAGRPQGLKPVSFVAVSGTTGSRALPGPFNPRLAGGDPDLVSDDRHHEQQVESERPEDEEVGAFEVRRGS